MAVSLVSDLLVTGDSITSYLPHIAGCMSSSHSGKAEDVFSNLQGRGIFFITLCHVTFIYLTIILVHLKRFIYQRIIFSEIKDKRKTIVLELFKGTWNQGIWSPLLLKLWTKSIVRWKKWNRGWNCFSLLNWSWNKFYSQFKMSLICVLYSLWNKILSKSNPSNLVKWCRVSWNRTQFCSLSHFTPDEDETRISWSTQRQDLMILWWCLPRYVCILYWDPSYHIGSRFEVLWPLELGGHSHCNFTNWNVTNVRRDVLTWFGWNVLFILLAFTSIHCNCGYHIVQKSKFVKNWWVRFWTMISKTNGGAFVTKLIVD